MMTGKAIIDGLKGGLRWVFDIRMLIGAVIAGLIIWKITKPKPKVKILRYERRRINVTSPYYNSEDETVPLEFLIRFFLFNEGHKHTSTISVDVSIDEGRLYSKTIDYHQEIGAGTEPVRVRIGGTFKYPFDEIEKLAKKIPCKLKINLIGCKPLTTSVDLENRVPNSMEHVKYQKQVCIDLKIMGADKKNEADNQ